MDIFQCFIEFFLVGTAAAQFEIFIPCRPYHSCGYFQQLETDSIYTLFPHTGGKRQPSEPIEQIISQCMDQEAVRIYQL